jgi:DNA-binding transcriptional MerR regulator
MMPIYEDMQGAGLIKIAQAAVSDVKLLSAVSNMTKLNNSDGEVSLKDLLLSAEIKSGRLYVEPFDMTIGGRKATIGGSTGVDGSLDYAMAMNVPSGQVGDALNSALASVPGMSNAIGNDITMNLGISGTYDELKVKLLSANPTGASGSGVKDALKQQAADKLNEQKEAATAKVEAAKDSVSAVINEKKEEVKEEIKEEVDKAKEETTDKAKDALKGLLKKKTGGG